MMPERCAIWPISAKTACIASTLPGAAWCRPMPLTPAVAMKADKDYGTVTEGKYADIIAVKGDVLKQVALLQRVDIVIKHGQRVK